MKRNLSSKIVKGMALSMAITLGSSYIPMNVMANEMPIEKEEVQKRKYENPANMPTISIGAKVVAENYVFEVVQAPNSRLGIKGELKLVGLIDSKVAEVNGISDLNASGTRQDTANGDDKPFRATFENDKRIKVCGTESGEHIFSVTKIGGGISSDKNDTPLMQYTNKNTSLSENSKVSKNDIESKSITSLTLEQLQAIFDKFPEVNRIGKGAFAGVEITGSSVDKPFKISATIKEIEENVFVDTFSNSKQGLQSSTASTDIFIDLKELNGKIEFNKNAFGTPKNRNVSLEVKNHIDRDALINYLGLNNTPAKEDKQESKKITVIEKEVPTVTFESYDRAKKEIVLNASEPITNSKSNIKEEATEQPVQDALGFSLNKDGKPYEYSKVISAKITNENGVNKITLTLDNPIENTGKFSILYNGTEIKDASNNALAHIEKDKLVFENIATTLPKVIVEGEVKKPIKDLELSIDIKGDTLKPEEVKKPAVIPSIPLVPATPSPAKEGSSNGESGQLAVKPEQTTVDLTNWFKNMPKGLKATLKEVTENNVKIIISGTPEEVKSANIEILIPKSNLTSNQDMNILENSNAKFEIKPEVIVPETPSEETTENTGRRPSGGGSTVIVNGASNSSSNDVINGNNSDYNSQETFEPKELDIEEIKLPELGEPTNFTDVKEEHWATNSIEKLSSAGIITGLPNGSFAPNGKSKRADVAVMLTRLLGLNQTSIATFNDVNPNSYYANAVGLLKEFGISNGDSNGNFNPEKNISRQETMTMIVRILEKIDVELNADTTVLEQYSDSANIQEYAKEPIAKLINAGIIQGNNGLINPNADITRAEMAVILDKIYDKVQDKITEDKTETSTEV